MRRSSVKLAEALRSPVGGLMTMVAGATFAAMLPALADVLLVAALLGALFIRGAQKSYTLPARMPKHAHIIDPIEVNPGTHKAGLAKGTFYLGNDRITGEEVWLTNRDAGVHMLVLGTTGSGKTEMLLGLCQNALNQGSGFMFVDGKAQDKIAFKIQDLCRARGRDDDVLILNFMTGARDIIGPQPSKITNNMNPFAYGSSGMLSQLVVGLMSSGAGGDDMWKDRAISFVEAISPPLVYLRENYGLILDVNAYRSYFELERLEELCWKGAAKYPGLEQVLEGLKNYLINLPAYSEKKAGQRGGQGDDTKLQHGFITMQLVRAFTSLADTYGHIVRVPLGEVYFPDVVKQRRILIAMLPSLEKTPSETANIGKIIVTALKNIMAEGLGSVLEGRRDLLDNDEGRALLPPYVVILDEYGYYAVKGFAVAFAQARSLGFVCVVGGQDLASFQRESKEEAVSVCGNTRIKAFGSIEDPEQTMDFVVKTGGKAHVAETAGFDGEVGNTATSYADQMNVHLKAIDRIDPSDIKEQIEGQFTFVWRSRVITAKTYFVNPKPVPRVQLNHFLAVPPPDAAQLRELETSASEIEGRLEGGDFRALDVGSVGDIDVAVKQLALSSSLRPLQRGIAAIAAVERVRAQSILDFRQQADGGSGLGIDDFEGEPEFEADAFLQDAMRQTGELSHQGMEEPAFDQGAQMVQGSSGLAGEIHTQDEEVVTLQQANVFIPVKSTGFPGDVFAGDTGVARGLQDALGGADTAAPMLDYNSTFKGVETIEREFGASVEEAGAAAREVIQDIEDATRYPRAVPTAKSEEQIVTLFQEFYDALDEE
ncbi:hypothetical protein ACSFA0_23800 [Variovorax sp. LT1P1]|uniref:hypothetical protein n=1 Tax=Variovorax sp. LT1P1 TaxID=3443730 RepID=UPI003F44B127